MRVGLEDFKRLEKGTNILLEKALKTIICNNIYNCYVVFKNK